MHAPALHPDLQLKEATAAAEQRHTAELLAARASLSAQGARALAAAEVSAKAAAVQVAAAAEQQAREAAARAAAELDTLRVQHARVREKEGKPAVRKAVSAVGHLSLQADWLRSMSDVQHASTVDTHCRSSIVLLCSWLLL